MWTQGIQNEVLFQNFPNRLALSPADSLQWRHNERDGVSNHQLHDCLLNRLFRRRSKKTSKLRVTGRCAGKSPVTGEFPAQKASYAQPFLYNDVIMFHLRCWIVPRQRGLRDIRFELYHAYQNRCLCLLLFLSVGAREYWTIGLQ